MTNEEFRTMCERHDLTYDFSDDGNVWRRGGREKAAIVAASKLLDPADVERIWNEVVDTKLVESARANFYWNKEWVK